MKNKKKAASALGMLIFLGVALLLFIMAADEHSVRSSGSPVAERMSLADFTAKGSGTNAHVELTDFYFGKPYLYGAKLVDFREVWVPIFPIGVPENASNLHLLFWIRNDRTSNERLIQSERDLEQFIADFRQTPRSISGVVRQPPRDVRQLTSEAYPGTNLESLQVLWARKFPDQTSTTVLWILSGLCVVAAVASGIAYRYAGGGEGAPEKPAGTLRVGDELRG